MSNGNGVTATLSNAADAGVITARTGRNPLPYNSAAVSIRYRRVNARHCRS